MAMAISYPIYTSDAPAIVRQAGQEEPDGIRSLLEQNGGLSVDTPAPTQPKQPNTPLTPKNPPEVQGPKNFEDLPVFEKQLIADDILATAVVISQVDKTTATAIMDNLVYFYGLLYTNLPFDFNQIAQSQNPIDAAFIIRQRVLGGELVTQIKEPSLGYLATKNGDIVTIDAPVTNAPITFIYYRSEGYFLLIPEIGMFAGSSLSRNPYGLPGDIKLNTINNLCDIVPEWQTNKGKIELKVVSSESPQGKELTPWPKKDYQGYIESRLVIVALTSDGKYFISQTKIVDQKQLGATKSFATSILSPIQSLQQARQQVANNSTTAAPPKKPGTHQ